MEASLRDFFQKQFPSARAIGIEGLRPVTGGYSRETIALDCRITHKDGREETLGLIFRRDPPPHMAILENSRAAEHRLLNRIAGNTGIPVPRSLFLDESGAFFDRPAMFIERLPGKSDLTELLGGADADQLESVATDFCERLAELHMTSVSVLDPDGDYRDPRREGIDTSSWDSYMATMLAYFKSNYANIAFDPLPVFYDAFCALQNLLPAPGRLALCHGDFQMSNFLYKDGKVSGVIDWENAHIGDPARTWAGFRTCRS